MYQKDKKKNINSVICTVPRYPKQLYIPKIYIPKDLNVALRNHLIDNDNLTPLCRSYIKCIESLSNVQRLSRQDYFTTFKICLYLEQHELTLEIERHKLINHGIKKVISNECFIINVPSMDSENAVIMPDDIVTLYEAVSKQTITAKITKVTGNDITVRVLSPLTVGIFKNGKFNINFYSQNWPLRCCHRALMSAFQYSVYSLKMIHPRLKTNSIDLISECDIKYVNTNISKNKEQEQAIIKVLNKKAHPAPYIIFGPPGTGKTATLVEIICQIIKYYPTKNILVCTASNAAADEITLRLIDYVPTYMIHRIYASSRSRNINKKIRKCANIIEDTVIYLPKEILILKKIVITTLVTSIRLTTINFREDHFSFIIIDEASQAIEPEMLIPLTLSCNETESTFQAQVVIAGDPYQLGPVVRSKFARHLLGKSMLERLMDDCDPYKKRNGKYNPDYITKLIKNYRSHKHILHVPNKQFYNNELKSCGGVDTQIALNWKKLPAKNFPMIFQEVLGTEERTPGRSVYNTAEVLVVMEYVRMLMGTKLGEYTVKEKDIGIITPFKEQQIQIIRQLEANYWGKISVGTIESFQGQERTIIILSTARSKTFTHDGKEHIGFLSNPKRFNVAITRAKALMIIIGNPHIICKNEHWKILWEYCKKHNGYIPFERCPLKPNLIEKLGNDYKTYLIDGNDTTNMAVRNRLSVTVEYGSKKIAQKTLLDVLVRGTSSMKIND